MASASLRMQAEEFENQAQGASWIDRAREWVPMTSKRKSRLIKEDRDDLRTIRREEVATIRDDIQHIVASLPPTAVDVRLSIDGGQSFGPTDVQDEYTAELEMDSGALRSTKAMSLGCFGAVLLVVVFVSAAIRRSSSRRIQRAQIKPKDLDELEQPLMEFA